MNINRNNNAHLKIGEKVICTKDVNFADGASHKRGEVYTVEPSTQAYFSLFTSDVSGLWADYLKLV
jgi:hypothetical protein